MNSDQLKILINQLETLWLSRTPANSVQHVEPESRVTRGELRLLAKKLGFDIPIRSDEFDRAIFILFDKLRAEYPNEKWSKPNSATIERRKEVATKF